MDIFQTTATAVALALSVSEFIKRYRNVPEEVRRILESIDRDCRVLKLVDITLHERETLLATEGSHGRAVVGEIDQSLKACTTILENVEETLTRAEIKNRVSLDRAKLVLRRRDLLDLQTELSQRVNVVQIALLSVILLDGAYTRSAIVYEGNTISLPLDVQVQATQHGLQTIQDAARHAEIESRSATATQDGRSLDARTGTKVIEHWIKGNMTERNHQSDGWTTPPSESSSLSLPSHTPTQVDSPVQRTELSGDDGDECGHDPAALEKLVSNYKGSAREAEAVGRFNSAERTLRQAISYSQDLEHRTPPEKHGSAVSNRRILQERLSAVHCKQRKWQEAISLTSVLLTSDPHGNGQPDPAVKHPDTIWHSQQLGAIYLGKARDEPHSDAGSVADDLKRASRHTLEAYRWRGANAEIAALSEKEKDRQLNCLDLLIKTYEHAHMSEEARTYTQIMSDCGYGPSISGRPTTMTLQYHNVHMDSEPKISFEVKEAQIKRFLRENNILRVQELAPFEAVDVETLDATEMTALFFAAVVNSDKDLVELVLDHGDTKSLVSAVDPREPERCNTALHLAATKSDAEGLHVIALLIRNDAAVDALSIHNHTPLAKSVKENSLAAAKLLLDLKANPDIADSDGWSPLHHAVHSPDIGMCNLLIARAPALVNHPNQVKQTPLHLAVKRERIEVLNAILRSREPVNINACDSTGHTALYLVASLPLDERRHEIFKLLKISGAEVDDDNPPSQLGEYQDLTTALETANASNDCVDSGEPTEPSGSPRQGWLHRITGS